jgi:large subunit ribosomal protein L17
MVGLAKSGTLHDRRQALAYLRDDEVVRKLFALYPARYSSRHGGYTTFARLPERRGDGAPMVYFMMIDSPVHKVFLQTMQEVKIGWWLLMIVV